MNIKPLKVDVEDYLKKPKRCLKKIHSILRYRKKLIMKLDFGHVKNYEPKNDGKKYGFVSGFSGVDSRYFIKHITDKDVENVLKSNAGRQEIEDNVCFWYTTEKTDKGYQVKEVYLNVQDIPDDNDTLLFAFINELHKPRMSSLMVRSPNLCLQLFANNKIPDDKLDRILKYFIEINRPQDISPFIRESQKEAFKISLGLLNRWKDLSQELPYWAKDVTSKLFSEEEYNTLVSEREDALKQEEERKKENFKNSVVLSYLWKNTTLPLSEKVKEVTLSILGEEKYNSLLSERQKFRLIILNDIVYDIETNLMWLRFAYGQTWENNTAMGEATIVKDIFRNADLQGYFSGNVWHQIEIEHKKFKQKGYAGFSDWRVPSINELRSLGVEVINSDIFPNSPSSLWSSTEHYRDIHRGNPKKEATEYSQSVLCGTNSQTAQNGKGYCVRFVRGQQKRAEQLELQLFDSLNSKTETKLVHEWIDLHIAKLVK